MGAQSYPDHMLAIYNTTRLPMPMPAKENQRTKSFLSLSLHMKNQISTDKNIPTTIFLSFFFLLKFPNPFKNIALPPAYCKIVRMNAHIEEDLKIVMYLLLCNVFKNDNHFIYLVCHGCCSI